MKKNRNFARIKAQPSIIFFICIHMAENSLLNRLDGIESRFEEVSTLITDPGVIADMKRYVKLTKEYKDLEKLTATTRRYRETLSAIDEAKDVIANETDSDLKAMAREQLDEATRELPGIEEEIKLLLIPADPEDGKNAIVEIRGGTGGDEAAIFAGDLFKMYSRYCESKGWQVAVSSFNEGSAGGYKEIVFSVTGEGVYGILKYESGVHRVQRVPETESGGRIHTSTITVAIMPEAEEVDVQIDMNDCKFDVFRASGNGGQCVNTTDSAVRLTHIPTGIVISCQDEKSQLKNKDKALKVLRAKLYDLEMQKAHDAEAEARRSQVGTGDRSEKIRTYNFPQGRVTDHRINLTLYKLDKIMDGDIQEIIDNCVAADQTAKLAKMNESA